MVFSKMSLMALLTALSYFSTANAWYYANTNLIQTLYYGVPNKIAHEYQPLLKVVSGCVPYPAIDDVDGGRCGSGLKTTGAINGGCSKSPGQLYTRSGWFGGSYGIMYAWYFPKDQIVLGPAGHVHDWEGIVVWLSSDVFGSANLLAVCPSRHGTGPGKWHCDKPGKFKLDGKRPKITYKPDGTHALFTDGSSSGFGQHALIDWSRLGALGQKILTEANFGEAKVPFLNSNFEGNMWNAWGAAGTQA